MGKQRVLVSGGKVEESGGDRVERRDKGMSVQLKRGGSEEGLKCECNSPEQG